MKNGKITITLNSDMCASSGDGFVGVVDTDICFDKWGLPYIPAKRIKGCLREAALEIITCLPDKISDYKKLYGEVGGAIKGTLVLENGYLLNYKDLVNDFERDTNCPAWQTVLETFTDLRTTTAMENGIMKEKSLRTMRVLKKDTSFELSFVMESPNKNLVTLLEDSVRLLRNMGTNRTRGLGEISCDLSWEDDIVQNELPSENSSHVSSSENEKVRISYSLYTDEPLLISNRLGEYTSCDKFIPGSALLGWFARGWVNQNKSESTNAHKNAQFKRLFLSESVIFGAAMPSYGGKEYYACPLNLAKNKAGTQYYDTFNELTVNEPLKSFNGFVRLGESELTELEVKTELSLHHSRPSDKGKGSSSGQSADSGQLFTYQAISKGHYFVGTIEGSRFDIQVLKQIAKNADNRLRLGRSRTAQFGSATITWKEESAINDSLTIDVGKSVLLYIDTPLIPKTMSLKGIVDEFGLQIERAAVNSTVVSGYNNKWNFPRQQMPAFEMGSVLLLKNQGDKPVQLQKSGWTGSRKNEGWGKYRLELFKENPTSCYAISIANDLNTEARENSSQIYIDLIATIAKNKRIDRANEIGRKHGLDLISSEFILSNSLGMRIKSMLNNSNDYETLAQLILRIKDDTRWRLAIQLCTGKDAKFINKTELGSNLPLWLKEFVNNKIGLGVDESPISFEDYQTFMASCLNCLRKGEKSNDHDSRISG